MSYGKIVIFILIFQLVVILSIWLNVPVFRQVLGFFFYFFVPGFLCLSLMKIKGYIFEKVIYSIALSVFILMFLGLPINHFYLILDAPLSLQPVLSILTIFTLSMCLLVSIFLKNDTLIVKLNYGSKTILVALIASFLPILSAIAAHAVSNSQTSVISLGIVLSASIFTILIALNCNRSSETVNAICIYALSLSTLLLFSMRSNYILGVDGSYENFIFSITDSQKHWDYSTLPFIYNSCLSVTILPTIVSSLLGVSGEIIFKIMFQILFAFLPVTLYLLFTKFFSKLTSFLATIVFIGQTQFISMSALLKNELGLLFFGVTLLLIFKKEKRPSHALLMTIFGFSTIVTHYVTAYLLITLLIATLSLDAIFSVRSKKVIKAPKGFSNNYVLTIAAITFLWYFYLFITPSESLVKALSNIANFIVNTGLYESTSPIYLKSSAISFVDWTDYVIGVSVKFLMVLGTVYYVFNFRKLRVNLSYTIMLVASLLIMAVAGTIPEIGETLVISRYLLHSTIFLAPMTIIGFHFLYDLMFHRLLQITKNRTFDIVKGFSLKNVFTLTIVILYFLVGTNAWSVTLGGNADPFLFKNEGESYEKFYIHPEEVEALDWLSSRNPDAVYCDRYGVTRAVSYGNFIDVARYKYETGKTYAGSRKVYALRYELLNETWYLESLKDKIIFLRYENVVMEQFKFLYKDQVITLALDQMPGFDFLLSQKQRIYYDHNGTVEILL